MEKDPKSIKSDGFIDSVQSHGVSPRDSHEISPTIGGGVQKLMILLRDLLEDKLQNLFGEEMGAGQGDPEPLIELLMDPRTLES